MKEACQLQRLARDLSLKVNEPRTLTLGNDERGYVDCESDYCFQPDASCASVSVGIGCNVDQVKKYVARYCKREEPSQETSCVALDGCLERKHLSNCYGCHQGPPCLAFVPTVLTFNGHFFRPLLSRAE